MPRRNFEQREYLTPNEAHVLFPDEAATFRSLFAAGKVAGFQRSTGKRTRLYLRADSIRDYYRRLEAETADALYEAEKSKPFRYADHPKIQAYRAALAKTLTEFADLMSAWTEGTADGVLKPAEVARIKTQGAEAIEAIQSLMALADKESEKGADARVEM